jgi:tRNA U34 5-carboxymethylaminomethyl modifying GTPase MnmE/TrmE
VEHRSPGLGGGVIGMDTHSAQVGRHVAQVLTITADPVLTEEQRAVVYTSLLIGGQPGSGKSALFNLLTVHAVLSEDDGATGGGRTGAEG